MDESKQTGLHLDQLLSQTVLKGEGHTTEQRVIKQNKNIPKKKKKKNSQPSENEPSSCLGYAFEEVVGFPLASSRADVLALWPTEEPCGAARRESWYFFFFFLKALILHSGSESHPSLRRQFRRGGGRNSWQQEREEEGATVFFCVLYRLWELKKPVCHIAQLEGKVEPDV